MKNANAPEAIQAFFARNIQTYRLLIIVAYRIMMRYRVFAFFADGGEAFSHDIRKTHQPVLSQVRPLPAAGPFVPGHGGLSAIADPQPLSDGDQRHQPGLCDGGRRAATLRHELSAHPHLQSHAGHHPVHRGGPFSVARHVFRRGHPCGKGSAGQDV